MLDTVAPAVVRPLSVPLVPDSLIRLRLGILTLLVMLSPLPALAQGQLLGAIHGTAKDQQGGVLPGVRITAKPVEDRPPTTTVTDASGFYSLRDLEPGGYELRAELQGFATSIQPDVNARPGLTLSVDLVMTVGGVDEIVTVHREAPLLDTSSATTAVNISGDLQRALPTSQRRNWSDALILTPGVISADSTFGGITQNYLVHGSNFSSHVLQIDGADMASATLSQTFYIAFDTDLIADVQVRTAGVDASAPLGTGAVMNVATKSGTNTLQGSAAVVYQAKGWNSSNVSGGTSPKVGLVQPDVSLGGPVLKDRLWFFGAYRRTEASTGVARTPAQLAALPIFEPSFEPFDLTNKGNLVFLKISGSPSAAHRVAGFYQSDLTRTDSGSGQDSRPNTSQIGGRAVAGRISSTFRQSLTSELNVSYNNKTFETPQFASTVPYRFVFRRTVPSGGLLSGNDQIAHVGAQAAVWTKQPASKSTVSYDLTYFLPRFGGSHEFKSGFYVQPRILNESNVTYINGGNARERLVLKDPSDPASGAIPFQRSSFPEFYQAYKSVGSDIAGYVQDVWRWRRVTTTIGIRIDRVRYDDKIFNVTTQDSIDLGPRVGLNYALDADGRSVVRWTWSRVPDRVAGAAFAGTVNPTETQLYDLDLDGRFETSNVIPGNSALSPNLLFDSALHQPYVNEFTAGYRRQLPGQVAVDVGVVRRLFRDRFTMVDTNGIYVDNVFAGYRDVSQNEIYNLTNNAWNWPVYTAFELSATKRTKRIEAIASYTRQWQHLAGTWQPHDPASFIQPHTFANDRGIGSPSGSLSNIGQTANSLSGANMSLSGQSASPWQDHIVRSGITGLFPWQVSVAANYTYQSGPWSGPIVFNLSAPDLAFGPARLTLSNGRAVSNPLATTVRFAYATRAEGQFHMNALHVLNIRVTKAISIGKAKLALMGDVFNATNSDADQGLLTGGNVLGSANYRLGSNRQVPRGAQVAARFTF